MRFFITSKSKQTIIAQLIIILLFSSGCDLQTLTQKKKKSSAPASDTPSSTDSSATPAPNVYGYVGSLYDGNIYKVNVAADGSVTPVAHKNSITVLTPHDLVQHPFGGYIYSPSFKGNSIYMAAIDGTDDSLSAIGKGQIDEGGGVANQPASFVINSAGTYAYAANFNTNSLSAFTVGRDGSLSLNGPIVGANKNPASLAINNVLGLLYVLNAGDGSISVFALNRDGTVGAKNQNLPAAIGIANQIMIDSTNTYLYAVGPTSNVIGQFKIDVQGNLALTNKFPVGAGPQKIVSNSDGSHFYVTNNTDNTVSAMSVTGRGGSMSLLGSDTPSGPSPSALAIDPNGNFLYVANNGDGTISQYTIDGTGKLAPNGTPYSYGKGLVTALSVSADGRMLYIANQSMQSVSAVGIQRGGTLAAPATTGVYSIAGGYAGDITMTPDLGTLYVSDYYNSLINEFSVDASGDLTSLGSVATGASPYGLAVDPSGQYLYVANNGDSTIGMYVIQGDGTLLPNTSSAISGTVATTKGAFSLSITPDGKYLYAGDMGNSSVAIFAIDGQGSLTSAGPEILTGGNSSVAIFAIDGQGSLTSAGPEILTGGTTPQWGSISPDGSLLFISEGSNDIAVFHIAGDGSLSEVTGDVQSLTNLSAGLTSAQVDPSGKYLYTANESAGTVSMFSVGAGILSSLGPDLAVGSCPYQLSFDPSGSYVFVADLCDNTITTLTINGDGTLSNNSVSSAFGNGLLKAYIFQK